MSDTASAAKTIDIGEISDAKELVFCQADNDHRYILQAPGTTEDYLSTLKRYMQFSVKRTTEHYIDDTSGKWYACYNVDCFDPPMAIIRARTFEDAYSTFCTEYERWIKVDDVDAIDYPENERDYNDNGTHVDTSNVQIHEMTLLQVIL